MKMINLEGFQGEIAYFRVYGNGYLGRVVEFGEHYVRISPYQKVDGGKDNYVRIDPHAVKTLLDYITDKKTSNCNENPGGLDVKSLGRNMLLPKNVPLLFIDEKVQDKK